MTINTFPEPVTREQLNAPAVSKDFIVVVGDNGTILLKLLNGLL
jgi:hypothetical protein